VVFTNTFARRSFIQVGVLGGLGLTLPDIFRSAAQASHVRSEAEAGKRAEGRAKNTIQIILPGGIAHQESWDSKPEAPVEYRGPLGVVKPKSRASSSARISPERHRLLTKLRLSAPSLAAFPTTRRPLI
jgi:hypothetical protein